MQPQLKLAEPGLPPLAYYIQDFLNAKSATRKDKTVSFYRTGLDQYSQFVGVHFWPPTDSSITSFLADCKRRGLSAATIHAYYRALRHWLYWLRKRDIIDKNPLDLVDEPPRPKKVPRAPEADIITRFFAAIDSHQKANHQYWQRARDVAIFNLLFDSGIRIGELAALWLADVSIARREILIRDPKNSEDRIIVFSELAAASLAGWLDLRASLSIPTGVQFVFVSRPTQTGKWRGFSADGIRQAKDKYLDHANLLHFRVHDLRHAYAIYSLMAGANLSDIQQQLGHKNIATTAVYLQAVNKGRVDRHDKTSPLSNLLKTDDTD